MKMVRPEENVWKQGLFETEFLGGEEAVDLPKPPVLPTFRTDAGRGGPVKFEEMFGNHGATLDNKITKS
jgi:hypothetical protein